jgi:sigma-E factor negative regulatory protein RseC
MIETEAQVLRVEQRYAWVKIQPHSLCGNCDPETGCKSVALTRLFGSRQQAFRVTNPLGAAAGDKVRVAIADGVLLQSALWGYGLPLCLLLASASLGYFLFSGSYRDLATLAGAACGVVLALALLRQRRSRQIEPEIVYRHDPDLPILSSCKHSERT